MTAGREVLAAELLLIHSDYVTVMGLTEGMGHVDATSAGDLKRLDAAHIAVAAIFEGEGRCGRLGAPLPLHSLLD